MADHRNRRDWSGKDWDQDNDRRNQYDPNNDNSRNDDYGRRPYYGSGYNQRNSQNDRDYRGGDDRNRHGSYSSGYGYGNEGNRNRDDNRETGRYSDDFGDRRYDEQFDRSSRERGENNRFDRTQNYNSGRNDNRRGGNSGGYSGGYDPAFAERNYNRPNFGYGTDFNGGNGPGNYADRYEPSGTSSAGTGFEDLWEQSVRMEKKHQGKGPKGYQRSETRIMEDVCDRLTEDDHVDASDIEVQVQGNVVVLSGTVRNKQQKRHAEDIVESVSGVQNVENRLRVQGHEPVTQSATVSAEDNPTSSTNAGSSGTGAANTDNATLNPGKTAAGSSKTGRKTK